MSRVSSDVLKIFCGRASRQLTESICRYLDLPVGQGHTDIFPDGELLVKLDEDVRGRDCFVIQSTCQPVNDNLMELLIFIDCLAGRRRRADHGRDALLRLRPAGPQGRGPRAHHRQAGGQPASPRRARTAC